MIHPTADVRSKQIGLGTLIWQFAVILENAVIGNNCNINCHTFIENDVSIGNDVTIKSGVYLWDGITIEDNVFIGPNVTFTNDKYPRSKVYPLKYQNIFVRKGASIGAASLIMGGIEIGEYSLVAAGSLVTRNVPPFSIVMGRPAYIAGYVDKNGNKLIWNDGKYFDAQGVAYYYPKIDK
jgi:UDP-2-acetamido-3-amino-2,3-dideoxy-glucuronate N-acetyltransferase